MTKQTINLENLFKEFPREAVSWRAQSLSKDGSKAMALAYIDARDVMKRLNEVCGIENWQNRYSHAGEKTVCEIGIRIGDEWVWKADGAGNTDIEAEKGSLSDAFKRAAVRWGIGSYLYSLSAPWVPCESYEYNGKLRFSKFTKDPWECVSTGPVFANASLRNKFFENCIDSFDKARNVEELKSIRELNAEKFEKMRAGSEFDILAVEELSKRYKIAYSRFEKEKTAFEKIAESYGQGFAEINKGEEDGQQ